MKIIDGYLNGIGMYRLVRDYLWILLGFAMLAGALGWLHYSPLAITGSIAVLYLVGWLTNWVFARVYGAPSNADSVLITVLILALIAPPLTGWDAVPFLIWSPILALSAKYMLAYRNKHIFNPAAIGVFLASLITTSSAIWWVGTPVMLPLVIAGGLLVVRKVNRERLFWTFIFTVFAGSALLAWLGGHSWLVSFQHILLHSPLVFFASVMLTEPLTLPPTQGLLTAYALITGVAYIPQVHVGGYYFTPESALLLANVFSYLVGPKRRFELRLKKILRLSPTTFEYVFSGGPIRFNPGQYVELTLAHDAADSRGIRRYFTIASAPSETDIRFGIKFYDPPSSYKASLARLRRGDRIHADQIGGNFTLPADPREKLVLVAGGIGVTPFRSMIKYLIDIHQRRDIILIYAARTVEELVYGDIFDAAAANGVRAVYVVSEPPPGWNGPTAVTQELIHEAVPDLDDRIVYVSGPQRMVQDIQDVVRRAGLPSTRVRSDYFPGFA